ncbi:hypothetical protein OIU34_16770 [Pararhizobium sp. BT-229]|uniref:hypothetical protein n=1 Tax=Pararhizobium sp. BT-229 TaxID=2986923 RepID=UPI0021F6A180|nr:hypothetical protein [Pararhizobium sp. BT-229]MCV9963558.1 hypothetical protein [Pararhizobium sp. BT-229]
MRAILALAALLTIFAPGIASAVPACSVPLERIIQTSPYLDGSMSVYEKTDSSITLRHKDDPRIIASFSVTTPAPSVGLSKREYMAQYEKELGALAAMAQNENRQVETSFYPYEPLAWRIVESTTLTNVGKALEGRMYIRLAENCLVSASYISPDSPNLMSRWKDMATAIADLRTTASPFMLTTAFEREDTAPSGMLGLAVGWIAPLLVIGLLYQSLRHYSRLDMPSMNTKTVIGSMAVMSVGLAINQHAVFLNGLPLLKYTDALLMLTTCFAAAVASLFLAQKATLFALITGAVTGASLFASSLIGWTLDPISTGAVGLSLLLVSVLGFIAWSNPFSSNA